MDPVTVDAAKEASSPTKKDVLESVSLALQHLASGKRNLLVSDVPAAVTELAEASRLMGESYGETGVECAEAFFYYGRALLEMARMESGVIEAVPDGEDSADNSTEDDDDEDEEEEEGEEGEGKKEESSKTTNGDSNSNGSEKKGEADKEESAASAADGDKEEEEEDRGDGNESIGSNEAGTSVAKDSKDQTEIDAEDAEDPSNLQLSWEMLELAKSLFQKHADSLPAEDAKRMELESRLSETYQILGELSIENENYAQAVEDLTCCLRRRQELLPEDSRCIAETHYQMGVALGFNLEFERAIGSLNEAIEVLEKRIANLKEKKESENPLAKKDAFYTREREIADIEGILPEIREKIADTKDMQEETFRKLGDRARMEEGEMEAVSGGGGFGGAEKSSAFNGNGNANGHTSPLKKSAGGDAKPISDISHMIKKRKKPDEETDAAAGVSAAKKSNISNGSSSSSSSKE